jgi:hypothetical protein
MRRSGIGLTSKRLMLSTVAAVALTVGATGLVAGVHASTEKPVAGEGVGLHHCDTVEPCLPIPTPPPPPAPTPKPR